MPALRSALEGRFDARHALLVSEILSHLDYLDEAVARMTSAIEEAIAPFADARDRLCSIPGVDRRIAEAIIGEIGVDMSRFPSAAHLASWAGMCPGQHESAGKQKRGTARHGDSWLQRHLVVAAMAAVGSKDTYLRSQYRRLSPRRGKQRAEKRSATPSWWPAGTSWPAQTPPTSTSEPTGSIGATPPPCGHVASSPSYDPSAARSNTTPTAPQPSCCRRPDALRSRPARWTAGAQSRLISP